MIRGLKIWGILLSLVLFSRAWGQEPTLSLRDFSGGMVTKVSTFGVKPNQCKTAVNVNFSHKYGEIYRRLGYEAMTDTLLGKGGLVGLYGYHRRDKSKGLMGILKQPSGLGYFIYSGDYKYSLDTSGVADSKYSYVYTGATPSWVTWKDDVFMANGRQRPLVYHDGRVTELILPAPGEPLIVPMDTTGPLNGEYRYAYYGITSCGATTGWNLVDNYDFDGWTDTSNATYWYESVTGSCQIYKDQTNGVSGGYCARFYRGNTGTMYLYDTLGSVDIKTDSTYLITAWFNPGSGGKFELSIIDPVTPRVLTKVSVTDSTSLVKVTAYVTAAHDSLVLRVYYYAAVPKNGYADRITVQKVTDANLNESYITLPIQAFNERIYQRDFTGMTMFKGCDTTDGDYGTLNLKIYRTRANPGDITDLDTFWLVREFGNLDSINLAALTYIDSIPDDSLGAGSYSSWVIHNTDSLGANSSHKITGVRIGAPTFYAHNPGGGNILPDSLGDSTKTSKLIYMMTYKDTLTGYESDSGRTCWIDRAAGDTNYIIGIPPIPYNKTHIVRNLYRAYNYCIYSDTTSKGDNAPVVDTFLHNVTEADKSWINKLKNSGRILSISPTSGGEPVLGFYVRIKYLGSLWRPDTVMSPFYNIATIKDPDVQHFKDTISWDSALKCEIYAGEIAPLALNYVTTFDDRMWGAVGSKLYWSHLDTSGRWEVFDNLALGSDEADGITAIVARRDYIKVYQHHTQFLVYREAGELEYGRQWLGAGYGCIAPQSMAKYGDGVIYLSDRGVESEIGSQTLEKASSGEVLSTLINDQLDFTPNIKRTAVGIIHDNKYWLSFPSIDTTWIYDFETGGWTKYTYAFSQATKYDTTRYRSLIPANDLLFIQSGSDKVWKADTMATDNSLSFKMRWEKEILHSNDPMKIKKIGVWTTDGVVGSIWSLGIYDAAGTHIWSDSASHSSHVGGTSIPRYREFGPLPYDLDKCHYYTIRIESWGQNATQLSKDFAIDGIDIWAEPVGTTKTENIEGH